MFRSPGRPRPSSSRRATRRRRSTSARPSRRSSSRAWSEIDPIPGLAELVSASRTPGESAPHRPRVPGVAGHGAGALPRHVVGRAVRRRRHAGQPLRLQPARRPRRAAPRSEESDVRLGRLRGGGAVLRRGAPRPARRPRALRRGPDGTPLGSIVVHAMLDYENLPFISSQNPVRRAAAPDRSAARRGRLRATTSSTRSTAGAARRSTPSRDTAWPLDDEVFARVEQSRDAVLGAAAARRRAVRRLSAERSRRHLRARLSRRLRRSATS